MTFHGVSPAIDHPAVATVAAELTPHSLTLHRSGVRPLVMIHCHIRPSLASPSDPGLPSDLGLNGFGHGLALAQLLPELLLAGRMSLAARLPLSAGDRVGVGPIRIG